MTRKLTLISERGTAPPGRSARPTRTSFTDREVNAFFRVNGHDFIPTSVVDPQVAIDEGGRVHARALVDIDEVKKGRPRGMFDPLTFMSGKVEVTAAGVLHTANGTGTFALETATVGGMAVPKTLLQMLVSSYTKSADPKSAIDLDKPFTLPANIRSIETQRGLATIVQ